MTISATSFYPLLSIAYRLIYALISLDDDNDIYLIMKK